MLTRIKFTVGNIVLDENENVRKVTGVGRKGDNVIYEIDGKPHNGEGLVLFNRSFPRDEEGEEYWLKRLNVTLANEITKYQNEHNLNDSDIAKKLSLNSTNINQIKACDRNTSIRSFVKICLAIGLAPFIEFVPRKKEDENLLMKIKYLVKRKPYQKPLPKLESEMRKDFKSGLNVSKVAKKYGINYPRAYYILKLKK